MSNLSERDLVKHFFRDDLSEENIASVLNTIHEHAPEFLSHAYRVEQESSPTGAIMVRNEVSTLIDLIVHKISYDVDDNPDESLFDDTVMRVSCMGVAGSLLDETGTASRSTVRNMSLSAWGIHTYIHRTSPRKPKPSREYWRGIAALVIADRNVSHPGNEDYIDFIEWVGPRDDLRYVAELAKERGTMNLSSLVTLYLEQLDAPPAIRSGTL